MGVFSWNCKGCGHSVTPRFDDILWRSQAVAMTKDGSVLIGEYDGYGRVAGGDLVDYDPEMWHQTCWKLAGKPDFTGPSEGAGDQGYFLTDESVALKEPQSLQDMADAQGVPNWNVVLHAWKQAEAQE